MENSFCFDPAVDLHDVDQFGFVNLNDAFEKGVIPANVMMDDESFNGVQNPATLLSRSDDVFCGLRQAEYVKRSLQALSERERKKVESQSSVTE